MTLSATRQVVVLNPSFSITTSITAGADGQTIVWNTVSNLNYQVWATTNLASPFAPIGSSVIPGNGGASFYLDTAPDPVSKFYEVVIVP